MPYVEQYNNPSNTEVWSRGTHFRETYTNPWLLMDLNMDIGNTNEKSLKCRMYSVFYVHILLLRRHYPLRFNSLLLPRGRWLVPNGWMGRCSCIFVDNAFLNSSALWSEILSRCGKMILALVSIILTAYYTYQCPRIVLCWQVPSDVLWPLGQETQSNNPR